MTWTQTKSLLTLLGVGASLVAGLLVGVPSAGAAAVPYTDARAIGTVGLCGADGKALTSGSVATKPFAALAVDSTAAPSPYNAKGGTATLYAYQPRQGVDPGEWSGEQLTGSSQFSNPAHPMASSTLLDSSLADFIGDFPPKWNGLIQLRVYLSAPDQPTYSAKYDATDLQVSGSTWKVVRGGDAACGAGTATSNENALIPQVLAEASSSAARVAAGSPPASKSANAPASTAAESPASSSSTSAAAAGVTGASGSPRAAAARSGSSRGQGSSGGTAVLAIVGALVVLAAVSAVFWWRRRSSAAVE